MPRIKLDPCLLAAGRPATDEQVHQLDAYSSRDGQEKTDKTLRISFGIVRPSQQPPHAANPTAVFCISCFFLLTIMRQQEEIE